MLVFLSYSMIAIFMYAVMSKRLSALTALVLIPVIFAIFTGHSAELSDMMVDGVKKLAPTGIMITFAILYFCMMTDAGLFNPLIKLIIKIVKGDPLKIVVGTGILGICVGLDGDGATTYIIVATALLPLYTKIGIRPQVMATVLLLSIGVMNILPWAGPFSRAASALKIDPTELFLQMIPVMAAGLLWVLFVAFYLGLKERKRLGIHQIEHNEELIHEEPNIPTWKSWFNLALTALLIFVMIKSYISLAPLFIIAFCIGLVVNFPQLSEQKKLIGKYADSVLAVSTLIFAAGIFVGIMSGTGMIDAIAQHLISIIPESSGSFLASITAFISMPFTYILTNDAFYFGILPILAETASHYGVGANEMAIASLIGQPIHLLSPMVASTYLLCSLTNVDYAENQKNSILWCTGTCMIMYVAAILIGLI
ncbi:CitMHS family citrate-Mg2+:H+ or citrate-Ca2+:H+ symporter [Acinetobacter baylyi]|uniref:CitMHS family citrate-Mg2+:H+ or citrate-Ca2+:H+ symporter n=1 Tax=Acinetobacter baylyi TaxID=202950 RepID=A0ABU0V0I7_ACIBI|nr:citrate:proton symporter [Acinetobacter baylyi]MDQ1210028.1 CitMHS family citrate-Mg2+:H+ or citrate-Ca2+:H+ symporter [Acinetobacter baylyi]MDR6106377.1 CitMHS family citrate-Mg2+:H+ or citrate-Ca2+:H+ symporter [Acinetobacter baylyi]MDR6186898.1 CitMHS family citrate-Mg2+:H+ or citrate-Ca2+:H+ symporter [Acinetobacter baylyi]